MASPSWLGRLIARARRRPSEPPVRSRWTPAPIRLELLEERLAPAFNLTLSLDATLGVTRTLVGNTATYEATASGANLDWNDVISDLQSGNNVVVNSGSAGTEAGNITNSLASLLLDNLTATSLTFESGTGDGLVGNVTLNSLDLQGVNFSVVVNAAGNISVGQLENNGTSLGSVVLTTTGGAISGGPIAAEILALSASTGIGTVDTPLTTAATNLEAQTATGGIFLSNLGDVTIGGASDALSGVLVSTSGDIVLTSVLGSIFVTQTGEIIQGPGQVTIEAEQDLQTGGNNGFFTPPFGAIASTGDTVTLKAGRDLILGDADNNQFGDVTGFGIVLQADRDVILTADTGVVARGDGTLFVTAGRDIKLVAPAGNFGPALITEGGSATLLAGGDFLSNSGVGSETAIDTATELAPGGNISITAKNIILGDSLDAGEGTVTLTATTGSISDPTVGSNRVFAQTLLATAQTGISLQTKVDSLSANVLADGNIEIDELDGVTLTSVSTANGSIRITTGGNTIVTSVVSSTSSPANFIDLTVDTGDVTITTINAGAAGDVTVTATSGNIFDDGNNATVVTANVLTLSAFRSIGQPGAVAQIDSTATSLIAQTTGAGPFSGAPTPGIWVADSDDLIVTLASTIDGVILIDAGANLNAVSVTAGGTGRNLRLRALGGNLTLGVVSAANDSVFLSATGAILDGNGSATNVTAGSLLLSAGSGAGVDDALETSITNLAFNVGTGGIELNNTGALNLTSIGPVFGTTIVGGKGDGAATILASSPFSVLADLIMGGSISLTAGEINDAPTFADDLTVAAGVTVQSTGGSVTLLAGDDVVLNTGSKVQSSTFLYIHAGFNDLDAKGGVVLDGTLTPGTDLAISVIGDLVLDELNAPNGTVSLRANNGAILNGNTAPLNLTSLAVALKASNGIGRSDNPLEISTANLEAETDTGGIFLNNTGDVNLGGVTPHPIIGPLTGVKVLTSGDILIQSSLDLSISGVGDSVASPDLITLVAGDLLTVSANVTNTSTDQTLTIALEGQGGVVINNNALLSNSNGIGVFINVVGTGSNAQPDGVTIANATLDAGAGSISIVGTSNATTALAYGVVIVDGSIIQTTDNGTIHIDGQGGLGSDSNGGAFLANAGTQILTENGALTIVGKGTGTGSDNPGVLIVAGVVIQATGTGPVSITGTAGVGSGSNNHGVALDGANTKISSGGGNVTVTGTGNGTGLGSDNYGVLVLNGAVITAGGNGSVTVTGQGGAGGGNDNYGVFVVGANSLIASSGGPVQVNGTGGGSGDSAQNGGVVVSDGGVITVGGPGTLQVTGTGGVGTGGNHIGVWISGATSKISSPSGDLTLLATVVAPGPNLAALFLDDSASLGGAGTSLVTITATIPDDNQAFGIRLENSSQLFADTGNIILNTQRLLFQPGTLVTGNSELFIQPTTANRDILVGGITDDASKLVIDANSLQAIQGSFTLVIIGRSDGSGLVTTDQGTVATNLLIRTPDSASEGIESIGKLSVGTNLLVLASGSTITATVEGLYQANALLLRARTGIGTPSDPVRTQANFVEASTETGGVFLHNTGDLTVGGVEASNEGITVTTSGAIEVKVVGALVVVESISTPTDNITLETVDQVTQGQSILILGTTTITTNGGNIAVRAGDDLTVAAQATLETSGLGTILLEVDAGNADAGVGGLLSVSGASLIAPAGALLRGNSDADTFTFSPSLVTPISVNGFAPETQPGDVANLNLTGFVGNVLQITERNTATMSLLTGQDVQLISIENLNVTNGKFDLLLDLAQAALNGVPFANGNANADAIRLRTTNGGTTLQIDAGQDGNPANLNYFAINVPSVRSISLAGSSDRTNFSLENPLALSGTAIGSHDTSSKLPAGTFQVPNVGLNIKGGTTLLDTFFSNATLAGEVSYYADLATGRPGGNVELGNLLRFSFDGLSRLEFQGFGFNESLLADATLVKAKAITVGDDGTPNNGLSLIEGNGGFTDVVFGGFTLLTVRGGDGFQTLTLNELDAADTTLAGVMLSGDNAFGNDPAPDDLFVNALLPGRVVLLVGGAGDDEFTSVPGLVTIQGGPGNNRLTVQANGTNTDQNILLTKSQILGGKNFVIDYGATGGNFSRGVFLNTGGGNDAVTITSTAGPTLINTGDGNDVLAIASETALRNQLVGFLTIDAGTGVNSLFINDARNPVATFYNVASKFVASQGWRINYLATGGRFGTLTVTTGAGHDLIRVLGVGATSTLVRGVGGNDAFRVFVGRNNLPRGLQVDGGVGANSLQTIDQSGGGLIRNFPAGPRSGLIQVSYAANRAVNYQYRNITTVVGINVSSNYITALFRHILGRNPTRAEVDYWVQILNTQGRLAVVRSLESSVEGRTQLVRWWFQIFFGRNPTPAEATPLVNRLLQGQSEETVLGVMFGSPILPLTAAFRAQLITEYYKDLFRRDPTPGELNAAVNSTQTLQTIRQLLEVSEFFFRFGL